MKLSKSIIPKTLLLCAFAFGLVQCVDEPAGIDGAEYTYNQDNGVIDADNDSPGDNFLDGYEVSEPVSFKNLQLFMIAAPAPAPSSSTDNNSDNGSNNVVDNNDNGNNQDNGGTPDPEDKNYVTLSEALERGWVEVHETSSVNELSISNKSKHTVFIHAGDIIRGGKQDRTLAYDMIIGPKEKHVPVESYCVESGRWSQRGNEDVAEFNSSNNMLSSRDMKISSKKDNYQGGVWEGVSNQQSKLNFNMSYISNSTVDVTKNESSSSLELTLNNEELQKYKDEYKKQFMNLIGDNTVGFAYAINGEVYNLDIYSDKVLFEDMFDKLLDAAIIEAISELDPEKDSHAKLSLEDLLKSTVIEEGADSKNKSLNKRTKWTTSEDDSKMTFISKDKRNDDKWVHKNLIFKGDGYQEPTEEQYNDNIQQINNFNLGW